jgi:outer membrane lipoprotein SlyB
MRIHRLASVAGATAAAALLAACSVNPTVPLYTSAPAPVVYPSTTTVYPSAPSYAPASLEYGQVTNIEYFPGGVSRSGVNVPGAVLGAVAGAALGNQIGSGGGRDAATVLGGAAGAALGSQVGRGTTVTESVYRITLRTDRGVVRTFDVPATGDLRVGDRVRVENGMIYRA